MYKVGDLVIYGGSGVCRVEAITTRDDLEIADRGRLYYILRPLYDDCTISSPADSTKTYMRPVLSADETLALIDSIPARSPEPVQSRALRELTERYDSVLRSHDCALLLELTMSIYRKKLSAEAAGKKLGAVDERYLKRAEELLFGEFAASLGISRDEVQSYIAARVEAVR